MEKAIYVLYAKCYIATFKSMQKCENALLLIKICQTTNFALGFKKKNIKSQNTKVDFFYRRVSQTASLN